MKRRSIPILLMIIAALLLFVLCGCGSEPIDEDSVEEGYGDTLTVGILSDNAPFCWVQEEESEDYDFLPLADNSGFAGGYDVQIASLLGKKLDVAIELVPCERGDLIDAVEDGDIDLIIAGMNPLTSRADHIAFSDSYYDNQYVVVVLKDGKYANKTSIDGFSGARLTAQTDSYIYKELLPQMKGITVMSGMSNHTDMRVALSKKVIDGYVTTLAEGMSVTRLHPEYAMVTFDKNGNFETDEEFASVAIGLAKDRDDLLEDVNIALHQISAEKRITLMDRAIYAEPTEEDESEE